MQSTRNFARNAGLCLFAVGFLAACDSATGGQVSKGIASLGSDFVRAFNQSPNDTPISLENVTINQSPAVEPFNP